MGEAMRNVLDADVSPLSSWMASIWRRRAKASSTWRICSGVASCLKEEDDVPRARLGEKLGPSQHLSRFAQ